MDEIEFLNNSIDKVVIYEKENVPICTKAELARLSLSNTNNSNFAIVNMAVEDISNLQEIFAVNYEHEGIKINTQSLINNCFIIEKNLQRKIEEFININCLTSFRCEIYKIISIINIEFNGWENIIKGSISKNLKQYKPGEKPLSDVIHLYQNNSSPETNIEEKIKLDFITFHFPHLPSIKISHPLVVDDIMDCLIRNYNLEDNRQIDFGLKLTKLKHIISRGLCEFILTPSEERNIRTKAEAHKIIASLFNLAGIEATSVNVKKWITRSN